MSSLPLRTPTPSLFPAAASARIARLPAALVLAAFVSKAFVLASLGLSALLLAGSVAAQEGPTQAGPASDERPAASSTAATRDAATRDAATGDAATGDAATGDAAATDDLTTPIVDPVPTTRLHVPEVLPDHAWVEVTSLAPRGAARLFLLPSTDDSVPPLDPGLPQGAAVVCAGAPGLGSHCMRTFLYRGEAVLGPPPAAALRHDVRFVEGTPLEGRYLRDGLPVVGAQVAVVPVDLPSELVTEDEDVGQTIRGRVETDSARGLDRPFTLPLRLPRPLPVENGEESVENGADESGGEASAAADGPSSGRTPRDRTPADGASPSAQPPPARPTGRVPLDPGLLRSVSTDAEGRFEVPPIAGGRYFLEATLRTGYVHRSEPFDLPSAAEVRAAFGPDARLPSVGADLAWELGDIEIALGLALEVTVSDSFGQPIPGAVVRARQGDSALDLQTFRAETGAEGRVLLVGFDAERPVTLDCLAAGHAAQSHAWELVPVVASCVLDPLASIVGAVRGIGGRVPLDASIALRPTDERSSPEVRSTVDQEGNFRLFDLVPGQYQVVVAAADHEAWQADLQLGPAERRDLGTVSLLAGRPLTLRVVDAASGEPLPSARVHRLEPAPARASGAGGAGRSVDSDGELKMAAPGQVALVVEAEAPEHASTRRTISVEEQRAEGPILIELARAGWIRVQVGSAASPCAGCRLRLVGQGGRSHGGTSHGGTSHGGVPAPGTLPALAAGQKRPGAAGPDSGAKAEARVREMRTDGRGQVLSPPLRPGWFQVRLAETRHLGSTLVERPDAYTRWARVTPGEITPVRFDLDRPVLRVELQPRPAQRAFLRVRGGAREEMAESQADGSYRIHRRPGEALDLFLRWWDPASRAEAEVRVAQVGSGFSGERFEVRLSTARIVGHLTWPASGFDRAPAPGVAMSLRAFHGEPVPDVDQSPLQAGSKRVGSWTSGPDGRFEIHHVPPGVYSLMAGDRVLRFVSVSRDRELDVGAFQLLPGSY